MAEKFRGAGYEVLRRGWPDFLLYRGGTVAFVEVKDRYDKLSKDQQRMAVILTELGLKVCCIRRKKGGKMFLEYDIDPFMEVRQAFHANFNTFMNHWIKKRKRPTEQP